MQGKTMHHVPNHVPLLMISFAIALPLIVAAAFFSIKASHIAEALRLERSGIQLINQGCYVQATEHLEKAEQLTPNNASVHCYLGIALYNSNNIQAVAELNQAIYLFPGYPLAYYYLGNALNDKGQRDEARAAWRKVLTLPERP